jgi:integrase
MTKPLTAAAVARLQASAQRREILDGACQGLYLIIQPSGVKSWAMRFRRPDGRQGKLTLGRVDFTSKESSSSEPVIGAPLTLAAARRLAIQIQHERAQGRDVISAALRAKADHRGLATNTFPAVAADFVERYAKRETRNWRGTSRLLGFNEELELIPKGLAERWSERAVTDIDGDDIHAVVVESRDRGVPGAERRAKGPTDSRASAMFAALSKMFTWALAERKFKLKQNPCIGVGRPTTRDARDRVLSDAELAAFWRAASDERQEYEAILKLLLLTGARLNEVAGMRRAELSDDGAKRCWCISGSSPTPFWRSTVVLCVPVHGAACDRALDATRSPLLCLSPGLGKPSRLFLAILFPFWSGRSRHDENQITALCTRQL